MALTATARHARVQERKKIPKSPPWVNELRGTLHVLMADSATVACLAQGIVPARFQCQCEQAVRCLHLLEEET